MKKGLLVGLGIALMLAFVGRTIHVRAQNVEVIPTVQSEEQEGIVATLNGYSEWRYHRVKSYEVYMFSAKTPGYEKTSAFITLFWGGNPHARLWFTIGNAAPTLPNSKVDIGVPPFYYVRFRGNQFASVLNLLRNEKRVYLHWNGTSTGAFLATTKE